MIELAPQHKIGLTLANGVMIASGCAGYGQIYPGLLEPARFGAIVTNPITLRPRRGSAQPRLAEIPGGFILHTGEQNPGVKQVIRNYQKRWAGLETAVIAHLPVDEPEDLQRTARAVANLEAAPGQPLLAGIELGLPHQSHPHEVRRWMNAVQEVSPLPLLVKLPLGAPLELTEAVAGAYADALVIGSPPQGAAYSEAEAAMVTGSLFGPALHSLALHEVQRLKPWTDLPLVAAGGIHTLAEAQAFLTVGATAVQLDSLLFIEPTAAEAIARALAGKD